MDYKTDYKVYQHRRKDNNEIFYVGHGYHARPWQYTRGRSKDWKRVFDNYGCTVEILKKFDNKQDACEYEIEVIADCKAKGINLVNKRSGGNDQTQSIKHSDESKALMSEKAKQRQPMSMEARLKISSTLTGRKGKSGTTGKRCFTNGKENKFTFESPGPEWKLGKTMYVRI
jgi:hypothetical protein